MHSGLKTFLRYSLSGVAAILLVFVAAGLLVRSFNRPKPDPLPGMVHAVQLAKSAGIDLDRLLDQDKTIIRKPELPASEKEPEREIHGFVQLAFRVNRDGSVSDVRVIGSVPQGVYDKQAKAIVRSRMYAPDFDVDGNAKAREDTDVIQFTVPESRVKSGSD